MSKRAFELEASDCEDVCIGGDVRRQKAALSITDFPVEIMEAIFRAVSCGGWTSRKMIELRATCREWRSIIESMFKRGNYCIDFCDGNNGSSRFDWWITLGNLTDNWLKHIEICNGLAGYHLEYLTGLHSLTFDGDRADSCDLTFVGFTQLTQLDVLSVNFNPTVVSGLTSLKSLTWDPDDCFGLYDSITDENLKGLTNLTSLILYDARLHVNAFLCLTNLTALTFEVHDDRNIDESEPIASSALCAMLSPLARLRSLSLHGCETDPNEALAQLTALEELFIASADSIPRYHTKRTPIAHRTLKKLTLVSIPTISREATPISLPSLTHLSVSFSRVDCREWFLAMAGLQLTHLDVEMCKFTGPVFSATDKMFKHIRFVKFKRLTFKSP